MAPPPLRPTPWWPLWCQFSLRRSWMQYLDMTRAGREACVVANLFDGFQDMLSHVSTFWFGAYSEMPGIFRQIWHLLRSTRVLRPAPRTGLYRIRHHPPHRPISCPIVPRWPWPANSTKAPLSTGWVEVCLFKYTGGRLARSCQESLRTVGRTSPSKT